MDLRSLSTKLLKPAHLWQAARTLSACGLAYGGAALVGLPNSFWALITAVVVTQPALNSTLAAGRDRVVGTIIGAAAGFLVIEATEHGLPALPLFWATMVPLAILTAAWPNLRLSCITLIIVVLVPAAGLPFARPIDRVAQILLGTLASILVAALFPSGNNFRAGADL